jgi:hypothetical protein
VSIEATIQRLARLYAAAGPRLGCALVEANVLLVLADLRGTTNFVQMEPTDADRARVDELADLFGELGLRVYMMNETRNANGRMCSAVVVESLAGYAYVSTQTQMPGFTPFDASAGWPGWNAWAKEVYARLKAARPEESEELRYDRWIGVALGYPDQAIEDAIQWQREGKEWRWLADTDLPSVERYHGAEPSFSYAPVHASDPGIVETIATWERALQAIYASLYLQQLADDPTFRAARAERERLRVFAPTR